MKVAVRLVWLQGMLLVLLATTLSARTMYVSDTFEIVVRSEKNTDTGRNIIRLLPTGTAVEVTEMDDSWATLSLADGRVGYALKRYLISRLPYKLLSDQLQQEVEQQKTQLTTLTEQLSTLQSEHQRLREGSSKRDTDLTDVTKKYNQLRQDASQYLQLKADYSELQRTNSQSQQQFTELNESYLLLKKSRNLLWFLSGAGVMFSGWIVGMITERFRGRRRRQGGYSSYQLPH